jgi:Plavaka transposase
MRLLMISIAKGPTGGVREKQISLSVHGIQVRCGPLLAFVQMSWYVFIILLCCSHNVKGDLQPFTHSFPRADIHELLSPDLLHQVIKGTFKDHLVTWVNEYLLEEHREARGLDIIADIDRRYVLHSCEAYSCDAHL